MAIRRPTTAAPDLSTDVIAILLHGWGAEPPAGAPRTRGFGGGFMDLGITGGPGPEGLWREHEGFLRGMAATWGWAASITGPDGVLRFYGEHMAAGYGDHEAVYPEDTEDA